MPVLKGFTRTYTRIILMLSGSFAIGVFIHELYHMFTLNSVENICLQVGGDSIAYVTGYGSSSEPKAYLISYVIMFVGLLFTIYDTVRTEINEDRRTAKTRA